MMARVILLGMLFGLVNSTVIPQTYFEDNFDNPKESGKKWTPLFGEWEFKNKEYQQLGGEPNSMSLVSDEYWEEEWNKYTEINAKWFS